jgi:hypothetical protein
MRFHIGFVTADENLAKYVSRKKAGIIPRDVSRHGIFAEEKNIVSVTALLVRRDMKPDELQRFLTPVMHTADGIILVWEDTLGEIVDPLKDAIFCAPIARGYDGMNLQNYLNRVLARVLKNFSAFVVRFADGKYQKAMLLPLNNFLAAELVELRNTFSTRVGDNHFSDTLGSLLAQIRNRQRPKSYRDYSEPYFVDDHDRYYAYGIERHAMAETKSPPHSFRCKLNGLFRFGLRYDEARHFNVSLENKRESISGEFKDCHETPKNVEPCSHLNIFPNGFF